MISKTGKYFEVACLIGGKWLEHITNSRNTIPNAKIKYMLALDLSILNRYIPKEHIQMTEK